MTKDIKNSLILLIRITGTPLTLRLFCPNLDDRPGIFYCIPASDRYKQHGIHDCSEELELLHPFQNHSDIPEEFCEVLKKINKKYTDTN